MYVSGSDGRVMGVGAYRHVVTLQQPGQAPARLDDPTIWHCSMQSAATQVIDGQAAFFLRGRFHPAITIETQLVFEGRTFQVQGVTDIDERHTEIQLFAVEVVGRAG